MRGRVHQGQGARGKNAKHAAQWSATLATHAEPTIGSLLVQDVTSTHVHAILDPIWVAKHETATRVRSRVENVLDWAIARGYRAGPNPARWKANLQAMLAEPKKVAKVFHHAALPVAAVPAFMERLAAAEGQGARARVRDPDGRQVGRGPRRDVVGDRRGRARVAHSGRAHEDESAASRGAV